LHLDAKMPATHIFVTPLEFLTTMCLDKRLHDTSYTLIERATKLDDNSAWSELHKRYSKLVYEILKRMNVSSNDADDIASTAFTQLSKSISDYNSEQGKFRTWFGRIVQVTALKYFRTQKRLNKIQTKVEYYSEAEILFTSPEINVTIEKEWREIILQEALDRIRTLHRGHAYDVLKMDIAGYSTTDISAALQIKTATVYTLRQRIKKHLMREFKDIEDRYIPH